MGLSWISNGAMPWRRQSPRFLGGCGAHMAKPRCCGAPFCFLFSYFYGRTANAERLPRHRGRGADADLAVPVWVGRAAIPKGCWVLPPLNRSAKSHRGASRLPQCRNLPKNRLVWLFLLF